MEPSSSIEEPEKRKDGRATETSGVVVTDTQFDITGVAYWKEKAGAIRFDTACVNGRSSAANFQAQHLKAELELQPCIDPVIQEAICEAEPRCCKKIQVGDIL